MIDVKEVIVDSYVFTDISLGCGIIIFALLDAYFLSILCSLLFIVYNTWIKEDTMFNKISR